MTYINQASDKVYDYIVEKIKTREWLPEMKIYTEAQLCEELNVSRVAVRQAIEKLVALSILRKVQGSGTYVESFENTSLLGLPFYANTKNNVINVLEFRKMFDSYNVELFIKKADAEDIKALEKNYKDMKSAVDNVAKFRRLDNEFHNIIAKGTKNPIIIQISNLFTDVFANHQLASYYKLGPENAIEHHGLILEAVKNRSSELASIYSRIHIETSLNHLEKLEILPDFI